METFLVIMIAGIVGLALMAVPIFGRHAHGGAGSHAGLHAGHAGGSVAHAGAHVPVSAGRLRSTGGLLRFTQPRIIFSFAALYGALGYAGGMLSIRPALSALLAILPAIALERLVVNRFWNMLMGFQGQPASPMTDLTFEGATALTEFHNGKGIVQVIRDGRAVQLTAHLTPEQVALPVSVGDKLRIEEVDAAHERVHVTLHGGN